MKRPELKIYGHYNVDSTENLLVTNGEFWTVLHVLAHSRSHSGENSQEGHEMYDIHDHELKHSNMEET